MIAKRLAKDPERPTVELGSGFGSIRETIPDCLCTDCFQNRWVDRVENAYQLSFARGSVGNLILIDVFHHLQYPGTALTEFYRVLSPAGRVVIFEPYVSLLGALVFGLFHSEPLALRRPIEWYAPTSYDLEDPPYYAAQGNASRIFVDRQHAGHLHDWHIVERDRIASIAYVASGGYTKPQLFPDTAYPAMKWLDRICTAIPSFFATRLLIVLEKREARAGNAEQPTAYQRQYSFMMKD